MTLYDIFCDFFRIVRYWNGETCNIALAWTVISFILFIIVIWKFVHKSRSFFVFFNEWRLLAVLILGWVCHGFVVSHSTGRIYWLKMFLMRCKLDIAHDKTYYSSVAEFDDYFVSTLFVVLVLTLFSTICLIISSIIISRQSYKMDNVGILVQGNSDAKK